MSDSVDEKSAAPIRVSSYGGKEGKLSISGLQPHELEAMQAMLIGFKWCRVINGRLEASSSFEPLPAPAQDEEMLPFWRRPLPGEVQYSFSEIDMPEFSSPGISISSLCGYDYTPEKYAQEAETLQQYGFVCLRSRRGEDGRFWEKWHLPGLFMARNELKAAVPQNGTNAEKLDVVIKFLCRHVSFGSLDVVWQRAAMVMD